MKFFFKITAFVLLAVFAYGSAVNAQQHAFNYVGAYKQAQDKRIEADKKLLLNMEAAADWLVNFKVRRGHFPELGVEQDNATAVLQKKIMKPSPYSMTGIMSEGEIHPCPVRFISDSGLIDSRRAELQKNPPSSWKAEPGTITVILGNQNYFLVWGAGADHLPVYDSKDNKYWLVWREFAN